MSSQEGGHLANLHKGAPAAGRGSSPAAWQIKQKRGGASMARVTPSDIIGRELGRYHKQITDGVNEASGRAAEKLTKKLRATAPKNRGKYARSIGHTSTTNPATGGTTYTVGAKGKHGRLTHLIANGHETRNGGRTKGNPFFKNAVNEVLPEYEREVKQVIERGLIE